MRLLLFAYLLLYLGVPALTVVFPTISLNSIYPVGFRISAMHEPGMTSVHFNALITELTTGNNRGALNSIITEPTNGRWILQNRQVRFGGKCTVRYRITVYYGTETVEKTDDRILGEYEGMSITKKTSSASANLTLPSGCKRSPTTVSGKPVCKGELIFEDDFDIIDWTKWSREVRISMDADDAGFMSFQRRPENFYVRGGQLHIVPSLLSDVQGFDEVSIFKGKLDLSEFCTGIVDMTNECTRQARFSQILPPVVSARARTRHFFSFRYGKVEVRAKIPKGDWLSPLILLQPLENYYGISGYASGQMRVAWAVGNELLEDANGNDTSGKRIYGGPVLAIEQFLRDIWFKGSVQRTHLGNDFHIYSLTWKEDSITLKIDGHMYAVIRGAYTTALGILKPYAKHWDNGHFMAPFDREFYLTLGVSVGGHSDFPDDCRNGPLRLEKPWENGDPKAALKFFKDRENWLKTWNGDNAGLHVDYIKVYAL